MDVSIEGKGFFFYVCRRIRIKVANMTKKFKSFPLKMGKFFNLNKTSKTKTKTLSASFPTDYSKLHIVKMYG